MDITPLEATFGAEITGLRLQDVAGDRQLSSYVLGAWDRFRILVIRGQSLTDPELVAYSASFGTPARTREGSDFVEGLPEIYVVSNAKDEAGQPAGHLGAGPAAWHADMTHLEQPPFGSILHALQLPPSGGDTYFADMVTAYARLPEELKRAIEGRSAVHDASHQSTGRLKPGFAEITDVRETPGAHHPLVRRDPVTGQPHLFLGRRPHGWIVGMEVAESERLLDQLWAAATAPEFCYRHQWRVGDVVMWSNLTAMHRRDAFDGNYLRMMHRTQIIERRAGSR